MNEDSRSVREPVTTPMSVRAQPKTDMQKLVRDLPHLAEFCIVIFISFGGFIVVSLWAYLGPGQTNSGSQFTELGQMTLIIHEIIALFAVALFLSVRGWPIETLTFKITWADSFRGLGLMVLAYVIYAAVYNLFPRQPDAGGQFSVIGDATVLLIVLGILVSIVNPIFEEVIVVGYVMHFIGGRYGAIAAIGVSTFIRLLYHLYQGDMAFIFILPMGLLFSLFYWQRRSLWPLIFAHGIMDLVAIGQFWG